MSSAVSVTVPPRRAAGQPVSHGVLHQRLDRQERHHHAEHLGGDPHPDLQPVTEPGPLQGQIAVDVAQFGRQRGELARLPERIPGEVGEFDEQVAGPIRIGPDEGCDRGQGVVEEMRRDLRPQGPHLRPREVGPRFVEFGQLQLGADESRRLVGCPDQVRRDHRTRTDHQRTHGHPADEQRSDHGPGHRTPGLVAGLAGGQLAAPAAHRFRRRSCDRLLQAVVRTFAQSGQQGPVRPVQGDGRGTEQLPQGRQCPGGGLARQTVAQRRSGMARRLQRLGGRTQLRRALTPTTNPPDRGDNGGEHRNRDNRHDGTGHRIIMAVVAIMA